MTTTRHHAYIASDTPRGRAEARALAAMERAWPDKEIHYVFGGFIVVPKGTRMTCASTLETLWERLMTGPSPASTVPGSVVHNELTGRPLGTDSDGGRLVRL